MTELHSRKAGALGLDHPVVLQGPAKVWCPGSVKHGEKLHSLHKAGRKPSPLVKTTMENGVASCKLGGFH